MRGIEARDHRVAQHGGIVLDAAVSGDAWFVGNLMELALERLTVRTEERGARGGRADVDRHDHRLVARSGRSHSTLE